MWYHSKTDPMKTVWKFPIRIEDAQAILLPPYAEILHVGLDTVGEPCIWAKVERTDVRVHRTLYIVGTGHDLPDGDNRHVGSFVHGIFVWHVWEPC